MRPKSQTAWETAVRCATLAQEADDPQEREHYERLRNAWTTLAKRCEPFNVPDVTEPDSPTHTRTPPEQEKGGASGTLLGLFPPIDFFEGSACETPRRARGFLRCAITSILGIG